MATENVVVVVSDHDEQEGSMGAVEPQHIHTVSLLSLLRCDDW